MGGVNDKFRQSASKAIMDTLGQIDPVRRAEKIEISLVVPLMHDGKAVEERDLMLLRHQAHIVQIGWQ